MNTKELPGKVVCITGAAGGIGLAIALAFAEVGANLALLDLNEEGLAHLAQEAREKRTPPVSVRTAVADLSTEQGVKSGIAEVLRFRESHRYPGGQRWLPHCAAV